MPTKLVRSLRSITPDLQGGIVTIGNFDGVHLGHQQLINKVVSCAQNLNCSSIAVTFEPHPFEFFSAENVTMPRLTRLQEKYYLLAALNLTALIILPFNHKLAKLSASDFVNLLQQSLKPKQIIVGDDFHFGYKRQGTLTLLQAKGAELGFSAEAMPTIKAEEERISSTRVRKALAQGDLNLAKQLLGHPYIMRGKVRHGNKLGRKLGFPTANINLHRKLTPLTGIFTVYVHGITNHPLPGVANIGIRPTIDGTRTLLEVHLLDFNQDIYGRDVQVEFCKKLREEIRYPNLDLLRDQIAKDVEKAKNYFRVNKHE